MKELKFHIEKEALLPLQEFAVQTLKRLISIPSLSGQEVKVADFLQKEIQNFGLLVQRWKNNLWVCYPHFDPAKPTILLNSHLDTVKPNPSYNRDPFLPSLESGKLYGLGSNDAGGALSAILSTFLYFRSDLSLPYNLLFAATAEEENSGADGISSVLDKIPTPAFALVGEPTGMELAIAEKGLIVLDCLVKGIAGHAARTEGENAIYKALPALEWFRTFSFEKTSPLLGKVKMTVTTLQAGTQHNVIPASCKFAVDIRTTEKYTHEEILETIGKYLDCEIIPRSIRLRPSFLPEVHPLIQAAEKLGIPTFGSSTLSDQALMSWPSVKIGPGVSARSHSADEFIYVEEVRAAVEIYIQLIKQITK